MMAPCSAYRSTDQVCSNGFVQKPYCRGLIGCFSCGHISDASIPHCLRDELPAHFVKADGSPALVPQQQNTTQEKT